MTEETRVFEETILSFFDTRPHTCSFGDTWESIELPEGWETTQGGVRSQAPRVDRRPTVERTVGRTQQAPLSVRLGWYQSFYHKHTCPRRVEDLHANPPRLTCNYRRPIEPSVAAGTHGLNFISLY